MRYVIGIDSGGTKTAMAICGIDSRLLHRSAVGSGNIVSAGIDAVSKNLHQIIVKGLEETGLAVDGCNGICIGSAGISVDGVKETIYNTISGIGFHCGIKVLSDIEPIMLMHKGDVMAVIAGTGSYVSARTHDNITAKAGGYGYIIGDECGGYDIAVKAIKKILLAHDSKTEPDTLTQRFCNYFGVTNPRELINSVYDKKITRSFIANAAHLVYDEYLKGNQASSEILVTAASDLMEYIFAAAGSLWNCDSKFTVVLCGGVMSGNTLIRECVTEKLTARYPLSKVILPEKSIAEYSAQLALELYK